jgi:hypothetical protein
MPLFLDIADLSSHVVLKKLVWFLFAKYLSQHWLMQCNSYKP